VNFLAHAYLSFGHPKVMVGNFIGDFVRGDLDAQFEKEVIIGILLHREIDSYTDQHKVVKEAQEVLKPYFSKYSVVVTDVYFDFFLSRDWERFDDRHIFKFAQEVYGILDSHQEILPKHFLKIYTYMKAENWLVAYGTMDGMKKTFGGLERRTSFKSGLEKAPGFLSENRKLFSDFFHEFFPDLISFSKAKLKEIHDTM
jgi:acyl carrier protein phosphodiesterase